MITQPSTVVTLNTSEQRRANNRVLLKLVTLNHPGHPDQSVHGGKGSFRTPFHVSDRLAELRAKAKRSRDPKDAKYYLQEVHGQDYITDEEIKKFLED